MIVLDFSGRAPSTYPTNVAGVMRYVAPRRAGGVRRSKCITEAELAAHHRAGRAVGFVFEASDNNWAGGARQGDIDGRVAVAELLTLGVPAGVAIYAAVDRGDANTRLPDVAAYLDAFHASSKAAGYRRGVYGSYAVVTTMLRDGHAQLGWQTIAWSGGHKAQGFPGVALYQHGQVVVDGTTCDVNDIWQPDWGQWAAGAAAPSQVHTVAAAPVITGYTEDHMHRIDVQIDTDKDGRGYRDVDVHAADVISVVCNTANPPDAGYKAIPDVARLDVNGKTRVVVEEAVPNGRIDVSVWAA